MRKGFFTAGNWLVDKIKLIDCYPQTGRLANIRSVEMSGGGVFNTCIDLAVMNPELPVYGAGIVGQDNEGRQLLQWLRHYDVDTTAIQLTDKAPTSFTDVMTVENTGERTFFHSRGANSFLSMEMISPLMNNARIFHLAYLLALDQLDSTDDQYGVVAARLLHHMQQAGYKTSADVISESGNRFQQVVTPCLKYLDYFIINEIEAGEITGEEIRLTDDTIDRQALANAANLLMKLGVNDTVIIHFPEGAYAVNSKGETSSVDSAYVPKEEIKGTVGAGDAFCAGALYGLHENWPLQKILQTANVSARFNLFSASGTGGAVTIETINKFITTYYGG